MKHVSRWAARRRRNQARRRAALRFVVAERALIVRCGSTEAKRLRRRILTLVEELGVRMGDDGMEYVEFR